jgi:hypothetical protein
MLSRSYDGLEAVPKSMLYDSLVSAVLAISYQQRLMDRDAILDALGFDADQRQEAEAAIGRRVDQVIVETVALVEDCRLRGIRLSEVWRSNASMLAALHSAAQN